ncbi:hypothetical protein H0H93_005714 [Arthromyces matolae]|nr:hypothetical protein H0H93_005714 [Arthromyces matolae]
MSHLLNVGHVIPEKQKFKYDEFLRVIRQYRHLKMLKRSGRGHDSEGIAKTKKGECSIVCPACPHPGINLPPDWETAPEDKRFLYAQFVGLDANFRLKQKHASLEERDPSLGGGWAFFVEETAYKQHISATQNQIQPKSTCVSHNAINNPDKQTRGLSASGVGTVNCTRHDFKRPNGVGDLQFGERYTNMDYMFFSSLRDSKIQVLVVSYDIVCQWHINLRDRMLSYPHELHLSRSIQYMSFLIPKFHLPAHIESCNLSFSFNLIPGVGRTDGEAPEQGWANINPISQSTKEMGPGARRDTIDDHFNDLNWKKKTQFGNRMLKKIREAASEFREHSLTFKEFSDAVPEDVRKEWEAQVKCWESDSSAKNPYFNTSKVLSERDVRLQLAQEVASMEETTSDASACHVHASVMIANGIGIEDEQRKLASEFASIGQHATATQLSSLLERANYLRRKITSWIATQLLFMAESSRKRSQEVTPAESLDSTEEVKVYNIQLWLPSNLATKNILVSKELREYEWRLRHGQAHDALDEIRRMLRLRSYLYRYKDRFVRGVKANTRSNTVIENATANLNQAAERYRIARTAMLVLANALKTPVTWRSALQELREEDLRNLSEGLAGDTEGRRRISWVWLQDSATTAVDDDPRFNDALRIEWCRSRARMMRWSEEVELLKEEMRRILEFLSWEGNQWLARAKIIIGSDVLEQEGRAAYAQSQAAIRFGLSEFSVVQKF